MKSLKQRLSSRSQQRGYQCNSPSELAESLRNLSSADLLAFRQRASAQYKLDCQRLPEDVEIVETDIDGVTVFQPFTTEMMISGSRTILSVVDAEVRRRRL